MITPQGPGLSAPLRPRWWQARAARRLRVSADGLWCWRDAAGGGQVVRPDAIAWGPGQSWIFVAGPGWRRPPPCAGVRREPWRPVRLRITVFAGSVAADTWRRLCVASLWQARGQRTAAVRPFEPARQPRGQA
ncbi:MAG: hypothetical protein AB7E55_02375 [Pigmentiphaga sp.]